MAVFIKKSPLSGHTHAINLPQYTQDEFDTRYFAWKDGRILIQEAFPEATADMREFIKTGITPEEWKKYIGTE